MDTQHDSTPGQRMLAAVMFTDVTGFSRLMGEDEDHTLSLVQRDLKLIAAMCDGFRGRVVKHTGDGVMALFTSGADAVECAQEIQRQFAEYARVLPDREVLQHRIGIHLGDVYVSHDEVMGDGVNIAQRVQCESPAGGICISQALYEVVRRRLAIKTVSLGARRLRNIDEDVHVYQVLPPGKRLPAGGATAKTPDSHGGSHRVFVVLGIVGVVLVAAVAVTGLRGSRCAAPNPSIPMAETVASGVDQPTEAPPETTNAAPRKGPFASIERPKAPATAPAPARPKATAQPEAVPPAVRPRPQSAGGLSESDIELFRRLDYDKDGKLSRQEIPFELRSRIMWADSDGDGAVTPDELKQARSRRLNRLSR